MYSLYTIYGTWVCSNHRFPLKPRGRKWSELFLFSGSFTEFCFTPTPAPPTPYHTHSTRTKRRNDTICSFNYSSFFLSDPLETIHLAAVGDGASFAASRPLEKGPRPLILAAWARNPQSPLRLSVLSVHQVAQHRNCN